MDFLINYKTYEGTAGEAGLEYARTVERVGQETGVNFAVMPQTPDVRLIASETELPVVAQAADPVGSGRGNGAVRPETLSKAGADGVMVDHPESRQTVPDVVDLIRECREASLETIVCVDDVDTGKAIASLGPDWLLFEKPEDVGTDRAISRTHPDRVREFVAAIGEVDSELRVLLGGGISSPEDVRRAVELGADAAGAASAALGADDREGWLRGIASVLQ